jgi:hypothetical protein
LTESPSIGAIGTAVSGAPVGMKRGAFMGSCKHQVWQAIRASSAAPYYLDDFSDGKYFLTSASILCSEHHSVL